MFEKLPFAPVALESWLSPAIASVLLVVALAFTEWTTGSGTWILLAAVAPGVRIAITNFNRWRVNRSL